MEQPSLLLRLILVGTLGLTLANSPSFAATKKPDGIKTMLLKRQYKKAASKLQQAAKAGDVQSQYRLAILYRVGLGVPADEQAAVFWFGKSAQQGHAKSARILKRMQTRVPATEKKMALRGAESGTAPGSVLLTSLPTRSVKGQDWLTFAAARNLPTVVTSLLGTPGANTDGALIAAVQANRPHTASELLKSGANVNQLAVRGQSPVIMAGRSGREDLLLALLQAKPDLAIRNAQGDSVLSAVAKACNADALRALFEAGAKDDQDKGSAAINVIMACPEPAPAMAYMDEASFTRPDADGRNSLWHAAYRADTETVTFLLNAHVDPLAEDVVGLSAIHAAALGAKPDNLKLLVAAAGGKRPVSKQGITPLMLASFSGCLQCVELLLRDADSPDARDSSDNTALMYAQRARQSGVVEALMRAGANADSRNENGDTPAKLAERLAK